MFGKIKYITEGEAHVESLLNSGQDADVMNTHVVFEAPNQRILGEVEEVNDDTIKIRFLGEYINDKYISGVIRKPVLSSKIRLINASELKELVGVYNAESFQIGKSAIYKDFTVCCKINDLLSNRIYIVYLLMELFKTPISLLTGIVIEDEGIPIDNVFCYMLINYGIVAVLFFIFQYIKIIRSRYNISIVMLVPLLLIIVSGFGEASWAAFGGMGSALFWILLCNQTYYSAMRK